MTIKTKLALGMIVAVLAVIGSTSISVYENHVSINTYNGSTRGYKIAFKFIKYDEFMENSQLALSLEQHKISNSKEKWVSIQGDYSNIFGHVLERVHGSIGSVYNWKRMENKSYISSLSKERLMSISTAFINEDNKAISHEIELMLNNDKIQ